MWHSNGSSWLRVILEQPTDDGLRLIYADWCEEQGDQDYAEFIRAQIALSRLQALGCHEGTTCEIAGPCAECYRYVQAERWRRQIHELLKDDFCRWGVRIPGFTSEYHRGFVVAVSCTCAQWENYGSVVVHRYPIVNLKLRDARATYLDRDISLFYRNQRNHGLDQWIVATDQMQPYPWLRNPSVRNQFFPGKEQCLKAQNLAALNWARQQAALSCLWERQHDQ